LGLHLAAQHPAFGAHVEAVAAQQPFLAVQGAAAQQPAFAALTFLAFFGLAEHPLQLLREIGAHVADATVGATAMVRPPATASIVARLSDLVMCRLLKDSENQGCYPWPRMGERPNLTDSFKYGLIIRKFSAIRHWLGQ
jgi:hypothetical protein